MFNLTCLLLAATGRVVYRAFTSRTAAGKLHQCRWLHLSHDDVRVDGADGQPVRVCSRRSWSMAVSRRGPALCQPLPDQPRCTPALSQASVSTHDAVPASQPCMPACFSAADVSAAVSLQGIVHGCIVNCGGPDMVLPHLANCDPSSVANCMEARFSLPFLYRRCRHSSCGTAWSSAVSAAAARQQRSWAAPSAARRCPCHTCSRGSSCHMRCIL
jgi:hypothetical protein